MNQKTIIINSEELFGNMDEAFESLDSEDNFERFWRWPDAIGDGFMSLIKLRPGLMLGIGDYRIIENIAVSFEFKYSPVVLGFSVSGNIRSTVNYEEGQKDVWVSKSGHSFNVLFPGMQGHSQVFGSYSYSCCGHLYGQNPIEQDYDGPISPNPNWYARYCQRR
jgi:hypothetical protein